MQDFSNYNQNNQDGGAVSRTAVSAEALFFQRIYTWMFAGLAVTAGVAYYLSTSVAFKAFLKGTPYAGIGFFVLLIGMIVYLSARIQSLSPTTAKIIFIVFAAVNGAVLTGLVLTYSTADLFQAFLTTSGVYGAMALYGALTKRSLQAWGSFLFMGLIGIILASLVTMIFPSTSNPAMQMGISVIGVLIFAGLTAYDHQRLRVLHATGLDGTEDGETRVVIMGALSLYLNFINLFIMLLQIFGGRSSD